MISIASSLISFFIFVFIYQKREFIFNKYQYDEKHAIHDKKVLRFGGLIFFFVASVLTFFLANSELIYLFLFFLPVFIVSVIEDIFHNISARLRFFSILLSAILFLLYFGYISNIDIVYLSNPIFLSILTLISIIALTNSFNLIDGANGLSVVSAICISISLFLISDNPLMNDFLIICIPAFSIFLLFNYPLQLFFLGDTGAYMLGFFISTLTIIIFNNDPVLLSWNAVLILIYPCTEIFFTFFRRIFFKVNPFSADKHHLHTLIFLCLETRLKSRLLCNNLVVVILLPLVLFGPITCFFTNNFLTTIQAIIFFIVLYGVYYFIFKQSLTKYT